MLPAVPELLPVRGGGVGVPDRQGSLFEVQACITELPSGQKTLQVVWAIVLVGKNRHETAKMNRQRKAIIPIPSLTVKCSCPRLEQLYSCISKLPMII